MTAMQEDAATFHSAATAHSYPLGTASVRTASWLEPAAAAAERAEAAKAAELVALQDDHAKVAQEVAWLQQQLVEQRERFEAIAALDTRLAQSHPLQIALPVVGGGREGSGGGRDGGNLTTRSEGSHGGGNAGSGGDARQHDTEAEVRPSLYSSGVHEVYWSALQLVATQDAALQSNCTTQQARHYHELRRQRDATADEVQVRGRPRIGRRWLCNGCAAAATSEWVMLVVAVLLLLLLRLLLPMLPMLLVVMVMAGGRDG